MIVIATVRDQVEHGYKISLWCPRCKGGFDHYRLQRLVMLGKGDAPSCSTPRQFVWSRYRRTLTADPLKIPANTGKARGRSQQGMDLAAQLHQLRRRPSQAVPKQKFQ
jgi:hypothetical protein